MGSRLLHVLWSSRAYSRPHALQPCDAQPHPRLRLLRPAALVRVCLLEIEQGCRPQAAAPPLDVRAG